MIQDALAHYDQGACYITLNPDSSNRKVTNELGIARSGSQVGNADIVRRKAMLVDIDPIRLKDTSSTDVEHQAALGCANRVLAFTNEQGWPEPLVFSSGNGVALIYGIDLPTDDRRLVKRTLESLARRFNNDKVKIETSVNDAARITRLVGTMNRKSEKSTLERPHRRAEIIQAPSTLETVPRELLEQWVEPVPSQALTEVLTDFRVDEWLRGLKIEFTAKNCKCCDLEGVWYTIKYRPNRLGDHLSEMFGKARDEALPIRD